MKNLVKIALLVLLLANCSNERNDVNVELKQAADEALKQSLSLSNEIPPSRGIQLLLVNEKFDEIEGIISALEKKYHENVLYESAYQKTYELFNAKDGAMLQFLDRWVDKKGTYIAYGARGFFYSSSGFLVRGTDYIQNVPKENIIDMEKYHQEAIKDFKKALEINPQFSVAYTELIRIYKAYGDTVVLNQLLKSVVSVDPRIYYARTNYIDSLKPVWGGSYREMEKFIDETMKYVSLNPRLWSLKGEILAEKARFAKTKNDYKTSIEMYTKALEYADRSEWLKQRGYSYLKTKQYKFALKDFDRYLVYKPYDSNILAVKDKYKQY